MAYNPNEQFASAAGKGSALRCFPQDILPVTFAAGSGTLAPLRAVAFNTSSNKWVPWTNGGANGAGTIKGFVWPDAVVLDSDEEIIGQVLIQGEIHFDDIPVAGGTLAELKTACRSGPRDLGIIITGLDQVR